MLSVIFKGVLEGVWVFLVIDLLIPAGTGAKVYLLKIEFFQLVNGVQYSLKNGAHNALKIIEVI